MMITAAQRRGELQRGVDILAFKHQSGQVFPEGRYSGFTDPRARNDPRAETRLRQRHNPRRIFFDLLLMAVLCRQRFDFAGRARHLIDRFDHRFVVVCHREIILRLGDIQDMQLLALSADNALQRHLRTHLARAGVHLRMRARVPGIETLCRMLARGVGVAIVPHAALACSSVRQQLVAVPLDEPWARRELSIVWRDTPSAALQALLEWLQASAAQAGIRPP